MLEGHCLARPFLFLVITVVISYGPECIPCKVYAEGAPKNLCYTPKNGSLVELEILHTGKGNCAPVL